MLPLDERISDTVFRHAVKLLDAGDAAALRSQLNHHPDLVTRRVFFADMNYFRDPTLLEFVAENPIRHGTLPPNIVEVTKLILDAGAKEVTETLLLVCSGKVPRECGVQIALIDLLCGHGADANAAMSAALVHAEFAAVDALLAHGARASLTVASALGQQETAAKLLSTADPLERHRALALASQFGHTGIVRLLLDAGESPDRFNPEGFHAHSTPLHQAAFAGHEPVVKLLIERGANLHVKDTVWQGTPADWARHAGNSELDSYLL